ncbi:ROK family transcriptional regulator [Phytohabitans rumicis]|uniref:Xylose repressor n=1 Tax=Phytohabitans rumicis TaxID=1076125 RepID=A0A6V8LI43_9ACTN|nr:ROK family transcriptional regulator [Phytohabitans rumicis]GFJ93806.1 xylose repressor [Phytohabitans rumicis]
MITMRTSPHAVDFGDVRATNLAVVLRHVRANGPCSRADIAAATGLNKATVSSIVGDLIRRRLLRETGPSGHRIGRPAIMLALDGEPYAAIGIAVGSDHLTAMAVDLPGTCLLSWHRSFAEHAASPGLAVAAISTLARRAAARVTSQGRYVLGLTVGVPGLVDGDGVVRRSPTLGWRDMDLRGELVTALRQPGYAIAVDNEANLAVLAEQRYGPYPEATNLAYLTGGASIGAGVVVDGRLLRGNRGFSGGIGHIQVLPDGPACVCGRRGCLEALAGVPALIRRALPDLDVDVSLALDIQEIVRRAKAHEPATLDALAETGRWLGYGASLLANIVNPEVVILGGYFAPLTPWLLATVEAELAVRTVAPQAGGCRIAPATLGTESSALGAAARILDHIDAGHLPELPDD